MSVVKSEGEETHHAHYEDIPCQQQYTDETACDFLSGFLSYLRTSTGFVPGPQ